MAVDLREIVGVLRIANDLERIGDLAKNIAKRVTALNGEDMPRQALRGINHITELAIGSADARRSTASPKATARRQSRCGVATKKSTRCTLRCFASCSTYMMEDPGTVAFGVHLLFCAKNIERIGDHATNIAEAVYYMVEGHTFARERPKADTTSGMTDRIHHQPLSGFRRSARTATRCAPRDKSRQAHQRLAHPDHRALLGHCRKAKSPSGAKTMMVEPCSNQPISSPFSK